MIKKPISDKKIQDFAQTILEKKVGTVCPIWLKKSPPFPQCIVDPSHVARGRVRSANID